MTYSTTEKNDSLIKAAAAECINDLISQYPAIEELDKKYEFSHIHNKRLNRLFEKSKRKENSKKTDRWKKFRKINFNLAAIISMFFILSVLAAFSTPQIRTAITNYMIEHNENYTKLVISSEKEGENNFSDKIFKMSPQYIPKGYSVFEIFETADEYKITYVDDANNTIYLYRFAGNADLLIDNNRKDLDKILINNHNGYIWSEDNSIILVCYYKNYIYRIEGNIDDDEIVLMAESIPAE